MVYDFPLNEDRVWDWAVRLAEDTALLSKDPSTQVGAVIFDDKKRILSAAYNGFPRKIADDHRLNDRDLKLKITLHAEVNALTFANAPLEGATLMCTHPCCTRCASQIIQNGIAHVCWPAPDAGFVDRWFEDMQVAMELFMEAGVTIHVR